MISFLVKSTWKGLPRILTPCLILIQFDLFLLVQVHRVTSTGRNDSERNLTTINKIGNS